MPQRTAAAPSSLPRVAAQPLWLLKAGVAFFLLLKLAYFLCLPPIGDEAYYWLWGQHPELSYLDHPPLHAWLLGLVSLIFGWNLYSLRVLTWLTFGVNVWVFWLFAKRLAPESPHPWFWATLLIYLGSPIMLIMGAISFHDHLLVALCLCSGYCFFRFTEDWQGGEEGFGRLYQAALFLGLAVLTKYNGVLLGIGYLVLILLRRDLRPVLARAQTYLAGLITLLLQAPVIYWNFTDGLASFRFHTVERWNGSFDLSWAGAIATLLASALALSIFLVVPFLRLYRREGHPSEQAAQQIAGAAFAVSTICISALGAVVNVFNYWNIVAYPLAFPVLVRTIRTRTVFWLHVLSGGAISALFLIEMAAAPIVTTPDLGFLQIYTNYDWDRIAEIVRTAEAAHPGAFVAATRYTTAAQLAFALHDPNVTDISDRHTEFNYWFDPAAHQGQAALILAAPFIPVDFAARQFHRVTLLQNIEIARLGHAVGSYQLYLADGYCGGPCEEPTRSRPD